MKFIRFTSNESSVTFSRRRRENSRNIFKRYFFLIPKRQKFVIAVIILSVGLFYFQQHLGKSGVLLPFLLAIATEVFMYWAMRKDIKDTSSLQVFFLPFIFSLAFSLFYFLTPARLIIKAITTLLYAFGLYSMFLSQNIFTVASIRTIALLSGARIVSFLLTLVSYFFLTNVIFSLHFPLIPTSLLLLLTSFLLIYHSIWTYTLEPSLKAYLPWTIGLALCLFEMSLLLWFWPSTPTVLSLFLTGFLYIIVGLSHVWLDKRLFKSILLEYAWIGKIGRASC